MDVETLIKTLSPASQHMVYILMDIRKACVGTGAIFDDAKEEISNLWKKTLK